MMTASTPIDLAIETGKAITPYYLQGVALMAGQAFTPELSH
jgi:hypothetical protein